MEPINFFESVDFLEKPKCHKCGTDIVYGVTTTYKESKKAESIDMIRFINMLTIAAIDFPAYDSFVHTSHDWAAEIAINSKAFMALAKAMETDDKIMDKVIKLSIPQGSSLKVRKVRETNHERQKGKSRYYRRETKAQAYCPADALHRQTN